MASMLQQATGHQFKIQLLQKLWGLEVQSWAMGDSDQIYLMHYMSTSSFKNKLFEYDIEDEIKN